jgi:predicted AlkP superfamily pyrophosphatase or phosphodiesterase
VATIQPFGGRREDLGGGSSDRSFLHLRETILVVQYALDGGLHSHAPSHLPGGWRETPRHLYPTVGTQRGVESEAGPIPPVSILGSCGGYLVNHKPTLTLVYLPHLDYNLQRLGPTHPAIRLDLRQIDAVCGELIEHVQKDRTRVIVLSEYGITDVSGPVHINRVLREANLLAVREELGCELLNAGASEAFAVADHQIAHVYVKSSDRVLEVKRLLEQVPGIELVLDEEGKRRYGLDHARSGELIAVSRSDRWFSYYYWRDDERAPDFARTVDIHRKPGYDPVELFIDPALRLPKLRVAWRLAQKKLRFRMLMDVIGLDASLPKGSHGRVTDTPEQGPLFITSEPGDLPAGAVSAVDVKALILRHLFGDQVPGMTR